MRAFIQSKGGIPRGTSSYAAWTGFNHMGVETVLYEANDELAKCEREDVVVGGLGAAWFRLQALGITPGKIDYPEELTGFLGRKVWRSTINHVNNERDSWPLFVKPVDEKRFVGRVVRGIKDLIGAGCSGDDAPVICSEVVEFSSEYRCFVRYGKILDVRHYRGDWAVAPDRNVVDAAIATYKSAPAAYAMDLGVTKDGKTLLVEVNDGYSLGSYGLLPELYAQFLTSRWSELVGMQDPLNFGVELPDEY